MAKFLLTLSVTGITAAAAVKLFRSIKAKSDEREIKNGSHLRLIRGGRRGDPAILDAREIEKKRAESQASTHTPNSAIIKTHGGAVVGAHA